MNGLLAYSGITAKVRAMKSHLISDADYREIAALDTVSDAGEYLKRFPTYRNLITNLEDDQLHRGNIEQLLTLSHYRDYEKLYRFSNLSQRKFLDLYFIHYEIALLKKCLRNVLTHRRFDLDLSLYQEFFDKHSKLDLMKLSGSENLSEFISNLAGSPYYDLLTHLSDTSEPTLFDYEMHLDLMHFKTMWKIKNTFLNKEDQQTLTQCFGSRVDLLNIQWIYRSKKYYNLSPTEIYSLLIPIYYRLRKDEIIKMTETGNVDEFYSALQGTLYGTLGLSDLSQKPDLEELYEKVLNRIHRLTSQKHPYSVATPNSYLYFKELEIQKIITVIESIHYGLDADTICSYIIKN